MSRKRNQTIAIARFHSYKLQLNSRLENMTDEEYLENPIGLDVGQYVEDLMKYCTEETVDKVLRNQDGLIARLGESYLILLSNMPYEEGVVEYA